MQKINYSKALEELSKKYPDNRFYASLTTQYKKRQSLTQKQIACIKKDCSEKLGKNFPLHKNLDKCKICLAEIKNKFDGTRIEEDWICTTCYDKYKLNKRAEKLIKEYGSSWWQHVQKASLKSAPAEIQKRKLCARCDTIEKKANVNNVGGHHVPRWRKKMLCWKCYVDTHVKAYKKDYYCPDCGEKIVEWAGTYNDWSRMRCKSRHLVNVNFLTKSPEKKTKKSKKHFVFKDCRNRSFFELEKIFGSLSEYKARALFERGKISSREFENVLSQIEQHSVPNVKIKKDIFSYLNEEKKCEKHCERK